MHPEMSHRVRYEDLVLEPEATLERLFGFLGVAADMSVLERAFERARMSSGPGDYKVGHTSTVHAASIGRGKRVPVEMIPPALLQAINEKLEALDCAKLDRSWNAEPRVHSSVGDDGWGRRLSDLMIAISFDNKTRDESVGSFAVVAEDGEDLRWVIDPARRSVSRGDGDVECVLIGTAQALALMISGEENLGVLLRSGQVRFLSAPGEGEPPAGNPAGQAELLLRCLRSDAFPAAAL
jgi:hypothetical protein